MVFRWLWEASSGLADAEEAFLGMLADGRHVFDLAMSARVARADPGAIAESLARTEERTDEAERRIRRLVLIHASTHGSGDLAACLLYMSVAKDAERVADLSKNLFGIARVVGSPSPGPVLDELIALRDEISPMITEAARIFDDDDRAAAETFVERARTLQRRCRNHIDELLRERSPAPQPAATALTYRHLSRIVANLLNIVSAVLVPLDQLDYPTLEDDGP